MRGVFLDDVLRFDLLTLSWKKQSTFGEKPCGRYGHAAILIDHFMFIYGGYFQDKTNELARLDLESGEWKVMKCSGEVPPGTDGNSLVNFRNQLIVFGGRKKSWISVNSVHVLDLETLVWRKVDCGGSIPCPRTDHADIYYDGYLYVQGGYDDGGQFLGRRNDLYRLNLNTFIWEDLTQNYQGSVPPELSTHKATIVNIDGEDYMVLVAGWDNYKRHRNDLYVLNLRTLEWKNVTLKGHPFHERRHFGMVQIRSNTEFFMEGDILAFGGCTDTCFLSDMLLLRFSQSEIEPKEEQLEREIVEPQWEVTSNEDSIINTIISFGNCSDLLEWSVVCKKWFSKIHCETRDDFFRQSLNALWAQYNRHLALGKFTKILPVDCIASWDSKFSVRGKQLAYFKNLYHQVQDVANLVDPNLNLVWHSFDKIVSLVGMELLQEEKVFSNWTFFVAVYSLSFEEMSFLTCLVATPRHVETSRETLIVCDPYVGSLVFSSNTIEKMFTNFFSITHFSKLANQQTEECELTLQNLIAKVFNKSESQKLLAEQFCKLHDKLP